MILHINSKKGTEINFCNLSAAEQYKSFLVQQFFKNAAEVEGE
jgi:hypothetical protein